MEQQAVITIGGIALPIGATAAEMVDQVTTEVKLAPIRFSFDFRMVRFTCNCEDLADGTVRVRVAARVGIIPFTAESTSARATVITIAQQAERELGGGIALVNGYIVAQFKAILRKPISATSIISAVTVFLIRLGPYLELLGEVIELPLAQQARKSAVKPGWRNKP